MESKWQQTLADGTVVTRTCAWSPPGCHSVGCGLRLYVKDGKLVKVEGDPEHPITKGRLCVRCLALKEYVYHPDRIVYPMKRDRKDRGKNKWVRTTWDEAYDIIAKETHRIQKEYGNEAIMLFDGTGREATIYHTTLCNAVLQTPNNCYAQSGWSCYGPRIAITAFVLGSGVPEMDYAANLPGRYDDPQYVLPKYVMLWGKDPLPSNPDGLWGHALIEMMKRGTKVIMIDPRTTWLGTRAAHVLRLRPGTDAALALALLNVIINEDLVDHEFIDKWCHGFEELKERVQQYPPSKVAEITGVPAEQIIEVARILGTKKPNAISWGLAIDQNPNGVQVGQAVLSIAAITGNLDIPGGTTIGFAVGGLQDAQGAKDVTEVSAADLPAGLYEKRIGLNEYPALAATINHAHPDLCLDTLETGKPYAIKMGWIQGTNLISPTNTAQPNRWYKKLKELEFVAAADTFMTPTIMAIGDVFLPVSTFAEHDGVIRTHSGMNTFYTGSTNKALTVGEARSDLEIIYGLGRVMNPAAFPMPFEEFFEMQTMHGEPFRYKDLKEKVLIQAPPVYKKHEKGLLRRDGQPGFETTSGKVELRCSMYEAFGDDPLPYYQEPRYGPKSEYAKDYPLILTTGARKYTSFHSEHRQIPSLREITPDPLVEIHPKTAAKYGIKAGDWVKVENMFGSAKLKANVTPIVSPDQVMCAHGWWFPEEDGEEPNLFGVWKSNINTMIPHKEIGKLGFGAPYKSMICKISKAQD
ncbi:MAG: molybdopterin-dependent oxidoreductase [Dehalobacter sp.]|nr:molybdopterin-dependent oxidoreductase [Dehalobacter sp.]